MNPTTTYFAIFEWRGDGRYYLDSAIGAKAYKRESIAQKACDKINAETNYGRNLTIDSQGFVVREVFGIDRSVFECAPNGLHVAANGRIREITA